MRVRLECAGPCGPRQQFVLTSSREREGPTVGKDEGRAGRRPTLDAVAALAGVSRSMVSMVLRGVAGSRPETRKRVFAAGAAVGYPPGNRARRVARGNIRQM